LLHSFGVNLVPFFQLQSAQEFQVVLFNQHRAVEQRLLDNIVGMEMHNQRILAQ